LSDFSFRKGNIRVACSVLNVKIRTSSIPDHSTGLRIFLLPKEVNVFRKILFSLYMLLAILLIASCTSKQASPTAQPGLPNPASVYCGQNGGKLEMRQDASGGTAGICVFPDGSECDEWAYYRGECKPGEQPAQTASNGSPSPTRQGMESSGGQIVFYSNPGNGYNNIYLLAIGTPPPTQLTSNESNTFSGPFSPDGTRLLFTGFGLTHSYVGVMNPDGSEQTDLTDQPDSDEAFPAWSPDGQRIAFTSRRDGNNEIYVMYADGSDQRRLTNSPKDDFSPAWSPDGSQLVFASDRDSQTGIYSLYLMNADGSDAVRLTKDKSSDSSPDWSPDGTKIIYQSIRDGQADIYTINVDGSSEINLTQNLADDYSPRWSPDGSQVAFQTNRDGNWEIYRMDPSGANPVDLTNNPADDQSPYWRP
jgi:Tol biopolymer transport system component/putative hemolysin